MLLFLLATVRQRRAPERSEPPEDKFSKKEEIRLGLFFLVATSISFLCGLGGGGRCADGRLTLRGQSEDRGAGQAGGRGQGAGQGR